MRIAEDFLNKYDLRVDDFLPNNHYILISKDKDNKCELIVDKGTFEKLQRSKSYEQCEEIISSAVNWNG